MNSISEEFALPFSHILIIEDDKILNQLIQKSLKREGYEVLCAYNAKEAFEQLKKIPNCLLLLDYILPDQQAKEFINELKSKNIPCPFIITTGYGDEKLAVEMMKLGAYDYIVKDTAFLEVLIPIIKKTKKQLALELKLTQAQKKLIQSEQKYRNLVETTSDIIWETNIDEQYTYVSPQIENILGYTPEELVGRSPFDFMPADESLKIKKTSHKIVASKKPFERLININLHKDGHQVIFETSGLPILDEHSKLIGYRGIDRDITQRTQSEETIRFSEQQLRLYLKNVGDAVYIIESNTGKIINCNERACHDLGYTMDELLKLSSKDIEANMGSAEIESIHNQVKLENEKTIEGHHKRKDGTIFPVEIRFNSMAPERPDMMIALVRDITGRKLMEKELRINEEKFRLSFMTGLDAFYIATLDEGRIVDVNMVFEDVFGYSRSEAIGRTSLELNLYYDPKDRERMISEIKTNGFVKDLELKGRKKNGEYITISISIRILMLENKQHLLGVIRDITERKKIEQKLLESENRFSTIFRSSPMCIMISNFETGAYTDVNEAIIELSGYSREELVGHTSLELNLWCNPEDRNQIRNILLSTGSLIGFESRMQKKSGEIVHIHISAEIILLNDIKYQLTMGYDNTERVQALEDIINSKKLLQRIINLLPIRIFWKDIDLKFLGCNLIFAKDAGKNGTDEVVGMDDFQMNWREQAEMYREDDNYILKSGESKLNFEEPQTTPNGEKIWLRTSKVPLTDPQGNIIGILGSYEDITARKLAEAELRSTELKYRTLFEYSGTRIVIIDPQGIYLMINEKAAEGFGLPISEIVGKSIFDFLPPDQAQLYFESNLRIIESGIGRDYEDTFNLGSNKRTYLISDRCLYDANGKAYALQSCSTDITDRKQTEKELRKLSKAVEQSSAIILITDTDGNIEYVNSKFSGLTGYNPEEVLGKNPRILKSGKTSTNEYKQMWAAIKSGKNWNGEFYNRKKNGEFYWESALISPIFDESGKLTNFLAVKEDITPRKNAEKALQESEEKYRDIFNNIQDCYYETNAVGIIMEVSPSINNITLYTREELIGRNIAEFYPNQNIRAEFLNEIFKKGFVNDYEVTLLDKDGKEKRCSVTSKVSFDETGKPVKIVGSMRNVEEKIRAEEELYKSQERYKELYEASNDIVYTMDFKGNFTSISPSAEKILGYKIDELTEFNMKSYISESSARTAFANISAKLKGKQTNTNYEVDFKNKDGSYTTLEINSMIRYMNEKPYEVSGIARDITARKKLSVELQKSLDSQNVLNTILQLSMHETSLQKVLDKTLNLLVNIPWLVLDKKAAIFLTNNKEQLRMASYLGLSKEVVSSCAVIHKGQCICGKVFESKNAIFMQELDHRHDINYIGMHDHGHYCVPILYGEQLLGILNTYTSSDHQYFDTEMNFLKAVADTLAGIIARQKAEEELQETLSQLEEKIKYRTRELIRSEEIYRTTVDTFNDWVYVVDRNLNLISINKAFDNFFKDNGVTNIFIGSNIRETFKFFGEKEFETIQSTIATGIEVSSESEYVVLGKRYYTHRIISPVTQNDEVVRVVATVHDYTHVKNAEEEIRKTLEKEKELNMLKSRFISTVSHEFRTPLAGILSSIQLLKKYGKKWDDEKKEKTYQQIVDAVHHTKTLLDDVSLIDKQQNQNFSFRPSFIDLKLLVSQIIEENNLLYNYNCKVNLQYFIDASDVYLDPTMVRHIISNIVSNAIKYSGDGKEVNITISEHLDKEIEFVIADNGIGIPEDDLKHLFVAFHRASNVEGIQGTGFGMSVVKRFVELHNGKITVESELGKGTTVTVVLPGKVSI